VTERRLNAEHSNRGK